MDKKLSLPDIQCNQIVTLYGDVYSEHKISIQMHCCKTALHNVITKYQADVSYSD